MRAFIFYLFLLLFSWSTAGQEYNGQWYGKQTTDERLLFSGLSYPVGANGEVFKNVKMNYEVTERLQLQLQHFYEKFGSHERTNSSFLFKWYVKDNLYFFAGPESEYDINQATGEYELMRVNMNIGLGYEVSPSLLLELGYHARTNKVVTENFGNPANPNTFSLRASF